MMTTRRRYGFAELIEGAFGWLVRPALGVFPTGRDTPTERPWPPPDPTEPDEDYTDSDLDTPLEPTPLHPTEHGDPVGTAKLLAAIDYYTDPVPETDMFGGLVNRLADAHGHPSSQDRPSVLKFESVVYRKKGKRYSPAPAGYDGQRYVRLPGKRVRYAPV